MHAEAPAGSTMDLRIRPVLNYAVQRNGSAEASKL